MWSGRGLVRDAQGLRWGRDSGCEGLGTQEFTGVKLGRTQWSLRCQESEMPPLFLMWVCEDSDALIFLKLELDGFMFTIAWDLTPDIGTGYP